MTFIQTDTYSVRGFDCDANGRLSIPALMNMMQESANRNALDYGIGIADLATHGVGWMLMRFRLRMHQYPTYGQSIRVVTYPTSVEKYFLYRDFQVLADDGSLLADASSTWLVFLLTARTMIPLPLFIRQLTPPADVEPLPKLTSKPDFLAHSLPYSPAGDVTVGWFSIDQNQHVNNVSYVQWLLESVSEDWLRTRKIAELDLVYRTESHWNDRLRVSHATETPDQLLHRIEQAESDKEVLLARSTWR